MASAVAQGSNEVVFVQDQERYVVSRDIDSQSRLILVAKRRVNP
ncbi:hypothetical protein [Thiohalorhabdus sp.]